MLLALSALSAFTWFCATVMIGVLYFFSQRFDDLGFALAALHHERRRAVRMDQVAAVLGQHRHELLVGRHHGLELVLGAAADIEEQRDEADAFRQQADDLLGHARPHGRIDHADDAAPTGKGCHDVILSAPRPLSRSPSSPRPPRHSPRRYRAPAPRARACRDRRSRRRPRFAAGSARPPASRRARRPASRPPRPCRAARRSARVRPACRRRRPWAESASC